MVGKRIQLDDDEAWAALNLLRQERRLSFQQLAEEALRDLFVKHGHPVDLKTQLQESAEASQRPQRTRKKSKA